MGKQVNFPVHEKYLKLEGQVIERTTRLQNIYVGLIRRNFNDGTYLRVDYNDLIQSRYEERKVKLLLDKKHQMSDSKAIVLLLINENFEKVNPRDLGISESKELFQWYDEHMRIISQEMVKVSDQLSDGGGNPVRDLLFGLGSAIPTYGVLIGAIGNFLKSFDGDSRESIIQQKNLLNDLAQTFQYYSPYYEDAKKVLIDTERGKIIEGKYGKNPLKPAAEQDGDNTFIIILLIGVFLFRKKIF